MDTQTSFEKPSSDDIVRTFRRLAGRAEGWCPDVGVILGSGLGGAADQLVQGRGTVIRMSELPGLATPRVAGHEGRFLVAGGERGGVLIQQGRIHTYEGHTMEDVTASVRLMAGLGIRTLILTNAAGGIREDFQAGDFMLIRDHLRLPILGTPALRDLPGVDRVSSAVRIAGGPQGVWDAELRRLARTLPTSLRIHEGNYAMMPGPAYETPAEVRMLRTLGASAVGMSTVPEAMLAWTHGMRVLGVSCITNIAAGLQRQTLSHAEVTATAAAVGDDFCAWLALLLQRLTA